MEAVKRPDDSTGLWRRRAQAYRQPPEVIAGSVANGAGVYQVNGRFYVKIEGGVYSMVFDAGTKQWRALHTARQTYRPVLEHNSMGGWRFEWERPEEWENRSYIIKRLHPALGALSDERLNEIAHIADLSLSRNFLSSTTSPSTGASSSDFLSSFDSDFSFEAAS